MRTQAIGEAGENDTAIKYELQKLKARIREIYHRKFIWNDTTLGIDGLYFIIKSFFHNYLFVFLEVQEILGRLNSSDDLLSLWNATYQVAAPMRDYYSTLIAVQNQQAKQNRTSAVTHPHIKISKLLLKEIIFKNNRLISFLRNKKFQILKRNLLVILKLIYLFRLFICFFLFFSKV